ncbi:hypothetical protein [Amycolatopsis sp. NPDC059021]|uniref:hypothetical protein n=1 Tax=Amycolatopsis sp. NPDC059021 TaxID=3346704 RepID=UPI003670B7F6
MLEVFVILGVIIVGLLAIAVVVDFKDRNRRGRPLARGNGLGQARRDDVNQHPQTGDQGGYLYWS